MIWFKQDSQKEPKGRHDALFGVLIAKIGRAVRGGGGLSRKTDQKNI
jgi:hypothetical protein